MSDEPPKNRGGRPRAVDPGRHVSTYLRNRDYDRLARTALRQGIPMSAVLRDLLLKRLGEREQDP
jgi:hypothetical protein